MVFLECILSISNWGWEAWLPVPQTGFPQGVPLHFTHQNKIDRALVFLFLKRFFPTIALLATLATERQAIATKGKSKRHHDREHVLKPPACERPFRRVGTMKLYHRFGNVSNTTRRVGDNLGRSIP